MSAVLHARGPGSCVDRYAEFRAGASLGWLCSLGADVQGLSACGHALGVG